MTLQGKTLLITGASRGIGRAIALRAAREGAHIIIAAKTETPHPKLEGTIYSVAKEVESLGGKALPLVVDVRDENSISLAVAEGVTRFGGIDILVNNASAIQLTNTLETPMKRYDLMMSVNVRATYACSQACLPHLLKASNPHILNLSPPLNMESRWFKDHVAYTMSKYGMSLCVLGMSAEFKEQGIAVNALWPKTTIATAAIKNNFPPALIAASRKPDIVADAAHWILTQDSRSLTGQFLVDETVLSVQGMTDFSQYAIDPRVPLYPDFFL